MVSVREQKEKIIELAIDTVKQYVTNYSEIGLFGSVARGNYSASSDVDLYIISDTKIDKYKKAELSSDLEELGVDIVFLTNEDVIRNKEHLLVKNILRDRRILDRRGQRL